ncbi:unnamed protein product [Dibothriocephalus latus]|uniref:FH2 domain-containing protein n=1 Tax=Dibothriocephalus latus TaxID=60516 RepID=A0A3P7NYX4_DIBLA|nr:unnamed protein product [Dibothriocephalus latus]
MHFIADTIEREYPDLLTFYEELEGVTLAAKGLSFLLLLFLSHNL